MSVPAIPPPEGNQALVNQALEYWLPDAVTALEPLAGGRPPVEVFIIDVSGKTGSDIKPGKYVLRIGPSDEEVFRHERAANEYVIEANPDFARHHIPRLLGFYSQERDGRRWIASLHDLAGGSLRRFAPPATESAGLLRVMEALSGEVLFAWARPDLVSRKPLNGLLAEVVGTTRAAACLKACGALFTGPDSTVLYENGHTFLNPVLAVSGSAGNDTEVSLMGGLCHRDLHAGNLHVSRDEGTDNEYWIMDCFQAKDSFIGFDHAYLEISILLNYATTLNFTILARCLENVEGKGGPAPAGTLWLQQFLTGMRMGISGWIAQQPGREDDLNRQFMLLRIIAALYWARRFDPESDKARLCVAYAGWYTRKLQSEFPETVAMPRNAAALETQPVDLSSRMDEATGARLWGSLWSSAEGFSANSTRYVLIAEKLPRIAELSALGHIPWSMVVDLDPTSDRDGLYAAAGPVLSTQRALHTLTSKDRPFVDFSRSTAWLMTAGSTLQREPFLPFRDWLWTRLDAVRQLAAAFRMAVGDSQIVVLVLPTLTENAANGSRDRLLRVLQTVDEMLREGPRYLYVGLASLDAPVEGDRIPLPTEDFLTRLSGTLGNTASARMYRLPGPDGSRVTLSPETMRVLQEHLDIVHDDIAGWDLGAVRADEAFWRGGLISWADLDAGRDVVRSVNARLTEQLTGSLGQHRTRTVVLQHQPGAGGTTAALRAAWDLHDRYPVAVLRMGVPVEGHRIQVLADRLHHLFVLTEMPVLFVAEDGDLSEANREILYRELAGRNARVTILYVRRIARSSDRDVLTADPGVFTVSEPLDEEESGRFHRQYTQLVPDKARAEELALLTTRSYERYRTPFFFGLITFEREFTKLGKYVHDHIEQVRGRVQDVLEFIALATIYSNTGLQLELVQKLMRVPVNVNLDLEDVLGPRPARLVTIRTGRLRLLHQLLAEEVLAEWLGGSSSRWQMGLGNLALDFIDAIAAATDPSTDPIRLLFRQVFVDRQSGGEDDAEDRKHFAPLVESLDRIDTSLGHQVLKALTDVVPEDPHFWNHLGRHQMYRLERDLDKAEGYLEHAIELAPDDHVHYHTLGLVRRSRMRAAIRAARQKGVAGVLEVIDRWFYRTTECFIRARKLNPEDIYSYITHVQAIIDVARALMDAARVSSVADLTSGAADWIAEHLADANELLDITAQLYNTLERRDDYLNRCLADIRKLYGDLDSVIELWEAATAGPFNTPMSRRSLAQAYYVRGNRSWRDLSEAELTRIVELANQNLSYPGAKEEDYRLWFEAYKLLPGFDIDEALGRLQQWAKGFPSWRAQYYRFCLMFYLWFTDRSDDAEPFRAAQQQSLEYMLGRAKRSFLWLAREPAWCPLIADTDLGEWDRQQNFWKETRLLQRVNGVIDYMNGPQAGAIQLDRGINAFFVPAAGGFLPDSDEAVPVNFFLGFSPEGLRAWGVKRGHSDTAVFARRGRKMPSVPLVRRPQREVSTLDLGEEASKLLKQRILSLCTSILTARSSIGLETRISELQGRIDAVFRTTVTEVNLAVLLAEADIRVGSETDPVLELTAGLDAPVTEVEGEEGEPGYVSFISPDSKTTVLELARGGRLRAQFRDVKNQAMLPGLKQGQVVLCTVSNTRRGAIPRSVEILPAEMTLVDGEVVAPSRLRLRVADAVRGRLEDLLASGAGDPSVYELGDWLGDNFKGGASLEDRLGVRSLSQFLSKLPGIALSAHPRNPRVHLRRDVAFGRLPIPPVEAAPAGEVDVDAVLAELVAQRQAAGSEASLQFLGGALRERLGTEQYDKLFGSGLRGALADRPGWRLAKRGTDLFVLQRDVDVDAVLAELVADREAAGPDATLQFLGGALRRRLGTERYEELFGGGLKATLAARPGWQLIQRGPDVSVLYPERDGGHDQDAGAVTAAAPAGEVDVDAVLAELVADREAAGREATLQFLGGALRKRLGTERYEELFAGGLKATLAARPGWQLAETRPGVNVLHRQDHPTPEE